MRGRRRRQTDVTWKKIRSKDEEQRRARPFCAALCWVCALRRPTAVGVSLFSGASDLVAVFVHTPTLAGAAVTLGWFEVAFVGASRNVGAWRKTKTGHTHHPNTPRQRLWFPQRSRFTLTHELWSKHGYLKNCDASCGLLSLFFTSRNGKTFWSSFLCDLQWLLCKKVKQICSLHLFFFYWKLCSKTCLTARLHFTHWTVNSIFLSLYFDSMTSLWLSLLQPHLSLPGGQLIECRHLDRGSVCPCIQRRKQKSVNTICICDTLR